MQPSHRIGKYELISRLGRGGMGEVYKAFHPQLQRYVAIKVLLTNSETDPEFITRFQHEAMAVARLRHPNIVQVYDFDIEGDKPYMVMEYLEGETLAQHITRHHKSGQLLPAAEIVRLFQQLCAAVDYAHKQGMLHRDIKPANVILNRQNDAILTDFGLAKITGVSGLTASGLVVGTPHYMSPEQAQGQPLDARSDVYSLSVMLYEVLAGKVPFDADTPVAIIMQHITTPPPPIERANPAVNRSLAHVALVGISKAPNERFGSAGALGTALGAALQQPLAGATGGPGRPHPDAAHDPHATQTAPAQTTPTQAPPAAVASPHAGAPPLNQHDLIPTMTRQAAAPLGLPQQSPPLQPPLQRPPERAPGLTSPPPKRPMPISKLAIVGILLLLLAISGGIFALALGNKAAPQTTTTTTPPTLAGSVVFSDSDPNDVSHPANVLTGSFTGLKQPANGSTYFAWLCDASTSTCALVGPLKLDASGKATLSAMNQNGFLAVSGPQTLSGGLIFEITQEQTEASAPPASPAKAVVYSGQLLGKVLLHIRHQIALFPKQGTFAGNNTALVSGVALDATILQQLAQQLVKAQSANDLPTLKRSAEQIFNLIAGKNAAQDLDGSGVVDFFQGTTGDLSDDGFGLGTNATVQASDCTGGQNTTYLSLAMQHACLAAKASGSATLSQIFANMQSAGVNLASLLKTVSDLAQKIATAASVSAVFADINTTAQDADTILNGSTGETQNQPGARQLLAFSQQMATISVSSV